MKRKKEPSPTLLQTIRHVNSDLTERFSPNVSRSLKVTGVSWTANIFVGFGKLSMGIVSMSFFICVNAFYTFGMVIAKYFALAGILKAKDTKEQYRYYMLSGAILTVSSVLYIAYSIWLFFHPMVGTYHMYVALAIATFTFTELTINIRGVIIERHNHTPLVHAIKMINLASSLICLVLTQTAILSFSDTQIHLHPAANGFIGILMGSCAALLGVVMIVRIRKIQTGKNYGTVYRKVKKLMKKESLQFSVKPVRYVERDSYWPVLYVALSKDRAKADFHHLQSIVNQNLQLRLICVEKQNSKQEDEKWSIY